MDPDEDHLLLHSLGGPLRNIRREDVWRNPVVLEAGLDDRLETLVLLRIAELLWSQHCWQSFYISYLQRNRCNPFSSNLFVAKTFGTMKRWNLRRA